MKSHKHISWKLLSLKKNVKFAYGNLVTAQKHAMSLNSYAAAKHERENSYGKAENIKYH